jgi:putative FmdB family regulatory protein
LFDPYFAIELRGLEICIKIRSSPLANPPRPITMDINNINGGSAMPTYEYRCEECLMEFSLDMSISEHDKGKIKCPECKSEKVVQQLSQFTAQTSRKS